MPAKKPYFIHFLIQTANNRKKGAVESDEFIRQNLVIGNGEGEKKQGKSK